MAGAVVVAASLTAVEPDRLSPGPRWFVPVLAGGLLVALIASDPGRLTRRSKPLRVVSIVLVGALVASALWATGVLVHELIVGGPSTNDAEQLLFTGSLVWLNTIIAFALLYWELDSGGSVVRAMHDGPPRDFAFPQQLNPALKPGWKPRFGDYLYLGLTNALAFSPTDAMPLTRAGKATMALQSLISLALLALVIARAVNVFT
jgi:hypothetical protein